MDSGIAGQLKKAFGTTDPYEVLKVERTATADEIKKAYRRSALRNHPDKGGDEEKFKAACVAHTILSDSEKRAVYDETGSLDDAERDIDEKSFDEWMSYFRQLYPKLTIDKIEKFSSSYKGGEEERGDVLGYYEKFEGNMKKLMGSVMLSEDEDIPRFLVIINSAIEDKEQEVGSYPSYETFVKNFKPKNSKITGKGKNNVKSKKKVERDSESDCSEDLENMDCDNNDSEDEDEDDKEVASDSKSMDVSPLKASVKAKAGAKLGNSKGRADKKTSSCSSSSSSSGAKSKKAKGGDSGDGDEAGSLDAMIRARQMQRGGGSGSLAALNEKYKSKGSGGSEYDIDDSAFAALQAKTFKKKK